MASDPLNRFSDRVEDYVRYRPGYPAALLDYLRAHTGLRPGGAVADVGSGTGIFTGLLLAAGAKVFAVEPNDAMRAAAEAAFSGQAGFFSVKGTSEQTGLADRSVDLITCAQAFHWFDRVAAGREFRRIARPGAWCALIWNTGREDGAEFARGYHDIKMKFGTDFTKVRHENANRDPTLGQFFGNAAWRKHVFDNHQTLDFAGLIGRMMSSSYAPKKGHPQHEPMLTALRELFDRCQQNGAVRMDYYTELFLGQLSG